MQITVACPNCRYELHLPSPDYLGRKGKCPQCAHKFVMEKSQASGSAQAGPEPPAKPQPKPKPPAPAKQQPKPARTEDKKTVMDSGRTRRDSTPVPAPLDADFKQLRDPDSGDADEPVDSPTEFQEFPGQASDSAPIPEGFWDGIVTPPPTTDSQIAAATSQRSAVFDVAARCPHCHFGVEFRREEELQDFLCPHCANRFCLIHPEAARAALEMPKQVGSHPVHKYPRIGVGPFGNVYRAKDGQSQEAVAIKVARGDQVTEAERESFLTTLRLVMQLKHPNIATLHEVDCAQDRVYLVSSYINGIDLSEYLTGSPQRQLSIREAASTCALIASVLHHAHKFGVIHGNLKPTNIRLDGDLKPYIFDFGLAHRERAVQITGNGRIVGQAAYLAPEQLPPNRRNPDVQTDVYAMGVIFYELLTGRRPFPGQGPELFKKIAKGLPPSPRSIKSTVPKALDTICMKCLEVDPRDRYQSAMDVYKELRLYLEDKPIHTRPPGIITRITRWCRRRPIMAGMLLTFICLALLGAGFIGWRIWQTGS